MNYRFRAVEEGFEMGGKRHKLEEIVANLQEIGV
jgi:hypothetical protein